MTGTHNRYFKNIDEVIGTLTTIFRGIQKNPTKIRGYLNPFL